MNIKGFLIFSILLTTTACSTVLSKSNGDFGKPMSGSKRASDALYGTNMMVLSFPPMLLVAYPVFFVNLLASAGADLILLPIDLPLAAMEKDETHQSLNQASNEAASKDG